MGQNNAYITTIQLPNNFKKLKKYFFGAKMIKMAFSGGQNFTIKSDFGGQISKLKIHAIVDLREKNDA